MQENENDILKNICQIISKLLSQDVIVYIMMNVNETDIQNYIKTN